MSQANVVQSLEVKNSTGFSAPSFFSANQYFVTPLRGTSNNNMEEQYLLGVDCLTRIWTNENNVRRVFKEFYDTTTTNPTNYYVLDIFDYGSNSPIQSLPDGGSGTNVGTLVISNNDGSVDGANNSLNLDNTDLYSIDAMTSSLNISSATSLCEKQILYFVRSIAADGTVSGVKVSEKNTFYAFENGIEVFQEIVTPAMTELDSTFRFDL